MMQPWRTALKRGIRSGSVAALTSTAALTACGWIERRRPAAPNNGPSQWIWGEAAAREIRPTLRHTAVGFLVHHAMSIFWATLYERALANQHRRTGARTLMAGLATAATASFVDYRLTPRRLEPGFDKHLGLLSLTFVYAAFGVGLAACTIMEASKRLR